MFGFLKKKKTVGDDALGVPSAQHDALGVPSAQHDVPLADEPLIEENGYFLNDRDMKIIVSACVHFAKSGGDEEIVGGIPEIGGKLRDKTELSPDDIMVISVCLQAYNDEMSRLIGENLQSSLMAKLREERVYFLVIIEKLTKYLTAR